MNEIEVGSKMNVQTNSEAPARSRGGGHADDVLVSAMGSTSLGLVLATTSERGLCSVILGNDAATMREELRQRFPYARLTEGDADSDATRAIAEVVREIEAPTGRLQLPLDLRGTTFQQMVWQALLEIPVGETSTYAKVARKIGRPQAVRAVGTACGANRLAVVVPCHRVLSSAGGLSGYRWGVEWKRALLAVERG